MDRAAFHREKKRGGDRQRSAPSSLEKKKAAACDGEGDPPYGTNLQAIAK